LNKKLEAIEVKILRRYFEYEIIKKARSKGRIE